MCSNFTYTRGYSDVIIDQLTYEIYINLFHVLRFDTYYTSLNYLKFRNFGRLISYEILDNHKVSTQRSTHLHEDVTGLRCDLKEAVLQVMTGVLGTPAAPAATHFPSEKRHFDYARRTSAILLMRQGRGERLVVDRTRVHAETGVAYGVASVVRLLHHVRHPHQYLSADKTRKMSSVPMSVLVHVYALARH